MPTYVDDACMCNTIQYMHIG